MDRRALAVFENKEIRRTWHNEEWWFSVVDVVGVLTESTVPRRYWSDLKGTLQQEGSEVYEKIVQLKLPSSDGKSYETDCANTEGLFRLIQSIPSKKAEPFKLWLASVGNDRINELHDPELAFERAMRTYLQKGYSTSWINQRLKTIEVRKDLTDEWSRVGIDKPTDYAILTNEITKAWSGKTVKEYKELKGLEKESLRDNMGTLELVLNMLAEATTTEFSKKEDPSTFDESKVIAKKGGTVAGNTRRDIEGQLGESIVTSKTALDHQVRQKILPRRVRAKKEEKDETSRE